MADDGDRYLAIDLGASSGRAVMGTVSDSTLTMEEIHRFPNVAVPLSGTLYWDLLMLWDQILRSLRICAEKDLRTLTGIGVDTWGVDFVLTGRDGKLLANSVHYRDDRTEGIESFIESRISNDDLYRLTGLPIGRVTSLAELVGLRNSDGGFLLDAADGWLMISDFFRGALCGDAECELTAAGSSQLLEIKTGEWSELLLSRFNLPRKIMPKIVEPGTVVGQLLPEISGETGVSSASIVAVAGHDTASAAVSVPFSDDRTAFLICGTWSVLGIAAEAPVFDDEAIPMGFINEFGFNTVLFVKNQMGMFLLEGLRREWEDEGQKCGYAALVEDAAGAEPFKILLPINSPVFFSAVHPRESIVAVLEKTGQCGQPTRGELVRALFEGLALSYRDTFRDLQATTGRSFERLCLVGGGARNNLLCQMVSDALGVNLVAGPAEATIVGNLLVQALATGRIESMDEMREILRRSFELKHYVPGDIKPWASAHETFSLLDGPDT